MCDQTQEYPNKNVAGISDALLDKKLTLHKDTAVSLLVARCIAEVIRICAPDAPYTDDELEPIFALFASHLENIRRVRAGLWTNI